MLTFAQTVEVIALFMAGELTYAPLAAICALPFIPLMKPMVVNRWAGKGFAILLIPCAAVTAAASVVRFAAMTGFTVLEKTPLWLIAATLAATAAYLASGGHQGIGRWAAFVLPLTVGFVLLSALLLMGKTQAAGWSLPDCGNAFVIACETVTLLYVMPALGYKEKPFRAYGLALLIAGVIWAAVWSLGCLVLEAQTAAEVRYPFFDALRIAKGGELIGRVEAFVIPVTFCLAVLKTGVCLHAVYFALKTLNPAKASKVKETPLPET